MAEGSKEKKFDYGRIFRKKDPLYLKVHFDKTNPLKTFETSEIPSLPEVLERALGKSLKYGDTHELESYRRSIIQRIINGTFERDPSTMIHGKRILNALGLSSTDAHSLKARALDLARKVNTTEVDFLAASQNIQKLFQRLQLSSLVGSGGVNVISLGCGLAPEAYAVVIFFGDALEKFTGFDNNPARIDAAASINPKDPRLFFEVRDLTKGLPEANPDLVIIRNPNIFLYNTSGQDQINRQWETIIEQLRIYPQAYHLLTFLTAKEGQQAAQWLDLPPDSISLNEFSTPLQGDFDPFGSFNLPIGIDKFFLTNRSAKLM